MECTDELTTYQIVEMVGYISRVDSAKHVDAKNPFVVSFVLIILAPVIIAAAT